MQLQGSFLFAKVICCQLLSGTQILLSAAFLFYICIHIVLSDCLLALHIFLFVQKALYCRWNESSRMSCSAELSTEHLDISESLMLSASSNLFTLITLLFLFTRLKHKTKCLCENIFKNFHANSWQPLKKVAFSWYWNYIFDEKDATSSA